MNVNIHDFSLPGRDRENQDSLTYGMTNEGCYFAVADGMGGTHGGRVASSIATEIVRSKLSGNLNCSLESIFKQIRKALIDKTSSDKTLANMGTTLTLCKLEENSLYVGHVGDSRAYLIRNNELRQLTKDQSEVQKLFDEGLLNQEEAKRYPRRNVLFSVLSPTFDYIFEKYVYDLQENDRLILMSDGVYNVLTDDELLRISAEEASLDHFIARLKGSVEAIGVTDDYSALVVDISKG